MATTRDQMDGKIYLHFHGIEEELDAVFDIVTETYPAEPYSWGGSRGTETTVTATLRYYTRHGQRCYRADAIEQDGDQRIEEQEEAAGYAYEPPEVWADDYGDWLRDRQMDRAADIYRHAAE